MFRIPTRLLPWMLLGCAAKTTTPGAKPADMSAAQHESAAQEHDAVATTHDVQYDATAQTAIEECSDVTQPHGAPHRICWTSMVNPTAEHLEEATAERRMAADHRAASMALQKAESEQCVSIAPDDRDISPFDHTEDILKVEPYDPRPSGKSGPTQAQGVVVTFRSVPGMTVERLQDVVDCHIARNNALGNVVPEMPNCPLVPQGVQARVASAADGFAITVWSDNPATAKEIMARAARLVPATAHP